MIGNRNFKRLVSLSDKFRNKLPIQVKIIAFESQSRNTFLFEDLEHGGRISKPDKIKSVKKHCIKKTAKIEKARVKEIAWILTNSPTFFRKRSTAKNKGSLTRKNWFKQFPILFRFIF